MFFTGIREAYEYPTREGWWIIWVTGPCDEFDDWLIRNPIDLWFVEREGSFGKNRSKINDHTLLIKSAKDLTLFRLRWYSEPEYMKVSGEKFPASYYLNHGSPNYSEITDEDWSRGLVPDWS